MGALFTDSFTHADGTLPAASPRASYNYQSRSAGSWEVTNNRVRTTLGNYDFLTFDSGDPNGAVQVTVPVEPTYIPGVVCRLEATGTSQVYEGVALFLYRDSLDDWFVQIAHRISGETDDILGGVSMSTRVNEFSAFTILGEFPWTLRLEYNDSGYTATVTGPDDAVSVGPVTQTGTHGITRRQVGLVHSSTEGPLGTLMDDLVVETEVDGFSGIIEVAGAVTAAYVLNPGGPSGVIEVEGSAGTFTPNPGGPSGVIELLGEGLEVNDEDWTVTETAGGFDGFSLGTDTPNNAGTSKLALEQGTGEEQVNVLKNGVWPYVYPFTAHPLRPTHTWGRVMSVDEVNGTQQQ